MRSFSKKLAFVLAAAMVVTNFAPAAKAEAAKEMAINKSSQILYVNEGINHKGGEVAAPGKGNVSVYDFSVKNKPADWKDTLSFKWTTSDDEVVAVKAGGVATAVGVGKATITCKVTDKATKETVATLKTKVTVKANAYDVEITNTEDADGLAFAVDSTIDLNRAMYDEDGNKTTKRGKLVTDYTRWVAVPDTGVTIDNATGKFTFAEPGEYELYCETYQSSKYTKTTAKSDSVFVTITKDLEFKQTSLKKFNIYLGTAADLTKADVTVDEVVVGSSDEYSVPALIKDVTMSADKKTATVELFYAMKDGVSYDVTVKGYDKAAFVASAGKPVAVNVWAQDENYKAIVAGQVTVGKIATLKYSLIDANGVDVTTETNEEQGKVAFTLDYKGKSNNNYTMSYYASNSSFEFVEVGDYAVVTAEYVEYDYATGNETRVASPEVTFYSVAKQNVTVKSVIAYTTQSDDWFDFDNADHDVTKLGGDVTTNRNNNHLVLKVALADGKELVVSRQGQTILDDEKIYRENGYVTVEVAKSSEDLVGVEAFSTTGLPTDAGYGAENYKITLYPRKTGVAQLMVYYNAYLADGNIQKMAVAPITIQVKAAPTLGSVQFNWSGNNNSATVVLPNTPDTGAEDLANGKFTVQIKDQYGKDYEGATMLDFAGLNDRAQELVDAGLFTQNWWNGKAAEYNVLGAKVKAKLAEMNTNNRVADSTLSGQFKFFVKAQDNASKAIVTNTLVVDMKGRTSTEAYVVGTDVSGQHWGGNIARFDYHDPGNAKDEKSVTFSVFEKMNGANVDYVNIEPYYTIDDIDTAATGYYFRVFKDGADVTKKLLEDTEDVWGNDFYQGTFETGTQAATPFMSYDDNSVTLRFSVVKQDAHGKYVAAYDLTGAGSYTFQLYYVGPSRLNPQNNKNVSTLVSTATKNVTTSNDQLKYTLVGRDSVVIKNTDGSVPQNAADVCAEELLYCFKIANKGNVQFNKYNPNNDNDVVEFNGAMIPYEINLKAEYQKPNSVFVESITFYEAVQKAAAEDDDNTDNINEAALETIYAAYTVPVNCYVEFQAIK